MCLGTLLNSALGIAGLLLWLAGLWLIYPPLALLFLGVTLGAYADTAQKGTR